MTRTSIDGAAKKSNVVLIGFMGCGKTSVGKAAAKLLGMGFLDTDEEIRRDEGMTIPDIFRERGESYFREAESRAVKRLAAEGAAGVVIATGGGIVKNPENTRLLREIGLVVYLRASPEKLFENISKTRLDRPLLDVPDPKSEIGRLLKERDPLYTGFCDAVADCGALDIGEAARLVAGIARERLFEDR